MAEYRAFTVGPEGHFSGFDAEAIEKAKRLAREAPVELWCKARLVTRLEPGSD